MLQEVDVCFLFLLILLLIFKCIINFKGQVLQVLFGNPTCLMNLGPSDLRGSFQGGGAPRKMAPKATSATGSRSKEEKGRGTPAAKGRH